MLVRRPSEPTLARAERVDLTVHRLLEARFERTGEQLDGVIAVDAIALSDMVAASGERIPLPDGGSIGGTELARFATSLDALAPSEREAVEALTKGIVAKLLHEPTVRLKDSAGSSQGDRLATSLAELFDL